MKYDYFFGCIKERIVSAPDYSVKHLTFAFKRARRMNFSFVRDVDQKAFLSFLNTHYGSCGPMIYIHPMAKVGNNFVRYTNKLNRNPSVEGILSPPPTHTQHMTVYSLLQRVAYKRSLRRSKSFRLAPA